MAVVLVIRDPSIDYAFPYVSAAKLMQPTVLRCIKDWDYSFWQQKCTD